MQDETHRLVAELDWWRRVKEETGDTLTGAAQELSDEAARTIEYLALLCGTLARDAGWGEDDVQALAASVRERVAYDYGIITDPVAGLLLSAYRGDATALTLT
jgi:hypothetical protein